MSYLDHSVKGESHGSIERYLNTIYVGCILLGTIKITPPKHLLNLSNRISVGNQGLGSGRQCSGGVSPHNHKVQHSLSMVDAARVFY
jgi:hypothetical protein